MPSQRASRRPTRLPPSQAPEPSTANPPARVQTTACRCVFSSLVNGIGYKIGDLAVLNRVPNLYRPATHLTVLDIRLIAHRRVQDHRDLLPAIRTGEKMFDLHYG